MKESYSLTLEIARFDPDTRKSWRQVYRIEAGRILRFTDVFRKINNELDPTLAWNSSCEHAQCGSCSVKINGRPMLACELLVENAVEQFGTTTFAAAGFDGFGGFGVVGCCGGFDGCVAGAFGTLTVAATHTQARYALPKAVAAFKRRYPKVELRIHQGNPTQICEQVLTGEADLGGATEMISEYPDLVSLPVYQWNRCVVVPLKHPLLKETPLTLEKLAEHPIVTYDFAFANRSLVQKAFETRGLKPHVVLSAQDSDVIKTYVELGLGVGILAKMAFDAKRDVTLRAIDASHLFESSTTRLGIKRGAYLRRYAYDFIGTFAPHLPAATVERAVKGQEGSRYEL